MWVCVWELYAIEPFIKPALAGVGQPHLLPDCLLIVPAAVHSITFVWCHQLSASRVCACMRACVRCIHVLDSACLSIVAASVADRLVCL